LSWIVYFLADHYPWWGIPAALVMAELANHFRRTGMRIYTVLSGLVALGLIALAVIYFTNDGFFKTRPTLQNMERRIQP
jgi:hypothetical protein